MVEIGCGEESQMLLVLRHNMTDAVKMPGESRSRGEESMGMEHMLLIFCRRQEETTKPQSNRLNTG